METGSIRTNTSSARSSTVSAWRRTSRRIATSGSRTGETGAIDVYFVANPQPATVEATCRFRMTGKRPELWDPVTGETRPALAFRQENGRTLVPLELPPSGSLFVLFRQPAEKISSNGRNSPEPHVVQEVNGPWTVHFDPRWGGPGDVTFPALVDWTSRPEPGIKYYSGTAIYSTTFTLASPAPDSDAAALPRSGPREIAGPGEGQWHGPGHCSGPLLSASEITRALRPGMNSLEVRVVNLWPNRMIGDQLLPPEKRFTSSTWNPFRKDSPLLESGLLGPVEVVAEVSTARR